MKKLLLLIFCLLFYPVYAQIHIGSSGGTNTDNVLPCFDAYGYSYTQQIVLASEYQTEDGVAGPISQIKWKITSGAASASNFNNWTVYLGHTAKTSFSSSSDFIPIANLTSVFSGVVTITQNNQWITIDLPTSFNYNATDNLVVAVLQNTAGTSANSFASYTPATSGNRGISAYRNTAVDVNNLSASFHHSQQVISQIQFTGTLTNCRKPQNLSVSNVTNTNATFSWTNNPNALNGYTYELRTSGTMGSGNAGLLDSGTLSASTTSYSTAITGYSVDYTFYIKAVCSSSETSNLSFFTLSTSPILNNDKMRIGNGVQLSVNNTGIMNGPYYYNTNANNWVHLTLSGQAFKNSFAINGDGTNEWNVNGDMVHEYLLQNLTFDYSNYVLTGSNKGYGIISTKGNITINGNPLEVTYTYNLGQNTDYIIVTCKVKNIGTSTVTNVRSWLGTADDYIGTTDSPTKTKGNIIGGNFVPVTNQTERSTFIKVESNQEGAFFYTTHPKSHAYFRFGCCNWVGNNVMGNPATSPIANSGDDSYAVYARLNDLAPDEYDEFDVYYAAGLLTDINQIIASVANANGSITNIRSNSAVFNAMSTQDVTGYYIMVPSGSAVPTATDIINGQNYQGVNLVAQGQSPILANQSLPFSLTNLIPNTTYNLYYVTQKSNFGGVTTSPITALTFTTLESLNATFINTDILCNNFADGSSQVNITGGLPPYIYQWSNGSSTQQINQIPAGNYSVLITDQNGENITAQTTITEPTALNSAPTQVNVLCHGESTGSTTAAISGGVAPYTYVWNNGITSTTNEATGLAAGTYEVTVTDANGCIIKQSFTITEPSPLNINLQETSFNMCSTCNDSNVVATITGGTTPYSYNWNDGVTTKDRNDLLNGTYTLTVTDAAGCTLSKNIMVGAKVELPYRDFTYTNGNAVSELNNFTTCQSGAVVKASSGRYTNGVWYDGSYELFVNNTSLGVFTGEKTIDISSYIPITSVRAVGNHNFWSWTAVEVKTYSEPADVPPTSPIVSNVYYQLNGTAIPLTATLNGVGTTLKWYTDELGSDYSAAAPTPLTNQLGTTSYYVSQANAVGCESARAKIDVIVVSPITYTYQINNLLCFTSTGSIDLSVSGGTGSYTYLWSNGATTEDITISQGGNYTCTITDANSGFSITTHVLQVLQPLQLKVDVAPINVTCFGEENGEATVTATDGTAPYTYSWNDADNQTTQKATGLVPGTYEVTVTDANGCIIIQSFTITEPTALNSTPSKVDVLCHGESTGSATAVISGGVAPYTYVWNNGITSTTNEAANLAVGAYEVTVTDANGCIIKQSFTITEPTALNSTPSQIDVLCHGASTGSATTVISGGVAPYTYFWNYGITSTTNEAANLAAGTYEVTATDANGCIIKQSFTITEPTALNSIPTQVDVFCHGESTGSATAAISGGVAPYTYVWNNGITSTTNEAANLAAGTYELTTTDANGCIIKQSFTINEPTALNSVPTQVNVLCHGESTGSATAAISGGVTPYTYIWNNGITSITNEATNLSAGTYEVTVTDANGCIITETFIITEPPLVVAPISHNQKFCIGDAKTVNDLVAAGIDLKWYLTPYAQTPVHPTALLTSGMYYGTQTVNGCESKSRVEIKVTVHNTPAPTAIAIQYFCANEVALIEDLLIMGTDILWYDTPVGGSPLNPLASLINNKVYYASQTLNGCVSITRTAVSVVIHPVNPITSTAVAVCADTAIGSITIDNFNAGQLKWYDAAVGGNELNAATMVINGTYYVSTFTNNACISDRHPLQVMVLSQVAVPTVGMQVFCGSAAVKDLPAQTIYGGTLKWYLSSAATQPLTANTPLMNGTYYVEQTIGQCSSFRTAVAVRVVSLTAPILNNVVMCYGATVDDIPANHNTSVQYLWFADNTTTVPLKGSDVLATGNYYAAFIQNGCVSNRTSVYITVNAKPAKPTGSIVQTFSDHAVVADLKMNEKSIVWFDNYSDAQNGINILSQNTVLQNGKDYYAVHVGHNACLSDPVSVKVVIFLGVKGFDLKSLEYYPNPVEHELTIKNADDIKAVTVYDILGKQIMYKEFNSSELKIDFSSYSAGTYMLCIETVKGSQFVKIIKN